jgi:hypothetical protein
MHFLVVWYRKHVHVQVARLVVCSALCIHRAQYANHSEGLTRSCLWLAVPGEWPSGLLLLRSLTYWNAAPCKRKKEVKIAPLEVRGGRWGCDTSSLGWQMAVRLSVLLLATRPPLNLTKIRGTHFC